MPLINVGSAPDDGTGDPLRSAFQAINNLYEEDTLSFSSTISWDAVASPIARIVLTGNTTINASNVVDGRSALLILEQDGTGGHSVTFGSNFVSAGGSPPPVAQGAGETTLVAGFVSNGSLIVDNAAFSERGYTSLTYGSTVAWNVEVSPNVSVTLTGDMTLNAQNLPSTVQSGIVKLVQDGTGGHAVTFGTNFTAEGGTPPAVDTDPNGVTYLYYAVDPDTDTVVIAETAAASTGGSATKTIGTTAYAASLTVDFDGDDFQVVNVTGDIELSTVNRSDGTTLKEVEVLLIGDGTQRALTFASGVQVADSVPANIPSGGAVRLTLISKNTSEADTIAMVLSQHATWGSDTNKYDFSEFADGSGILPIFTNSLGAEATNNIVSNTGTIGDKYIEMGVSVDSSRNYLTINDLDTVDDVEILVRFRVPTAGGNVVVAGMALRTSGSVGNANAYRYSSNFVDVTAGDTKLQIINRVNGSSAAAQEDLSWSWALNQWYYMRVQVIGNTQKMKAWQPADPLDPTADEPGTWNVTAGYTANTTGKHGFYLFDLEETHQYDFMSYSKNPSTVSAPAP